MNIEWWHIVALAFVVWRVVAECRWLVRQVIYRWSDAESHPFVCLIGLHTWGEWHHYIHDEVMLHQCQRCSIFRHEPLWKSWWRLRSWFSLNYWKWPVLHALYTACGERRFPLPMIPPLRETQDWFLRHDRGI